MADIIIKTDLKSILKEIHDEVHTRRSWEQDVRAVQTIVRKYIGLIDEGKLKVTK